ncbi:hypothetical protein CMUS01_14867 [Colletotrichum musicola]|uniref:Integral membrane protein n=1 Tax=Colletotrichum musicola TaxID=2175873 RepID=A0A8H6J1E6_9PEZI|nr:hypothetical protein CMUS01_14867 [Colletotrichum musicola]
MGMTIFDRLALAGDFCVSAAASFALHAESSGHYRLKLWQKGGAEGWNSSPNDRVQCYPNCDERSEIPLVWSQGLSDGTLAVALLSLILMVARLVMGHLGQMNRIFSILYDGLLTVLWLHSLSLQTSGDPSDPQHPSTSPWFFTRQCPRDVATACHIVQAGYAFSVIAAVFYSGRLIATAVQAARGWRSNRKGRYRAVPEEGDIDEEDDISDEEARRRERDKYLYQEALSPVLAFFPADAR